MAERNRVTPFGEIVAIEQRGLFMGNRGNIHMGAEYVIARPWQVGRWTALFFWDEAVALAAGHRPCALCRRGDYNAWLDAWASAFGERPRADPMDRTLHAERGDGKRKWRHRMPWRDLLVGAFVAVEDVPALVLEDRLVPWRAEGYSEPFDRPGGGGDTVLTPPSTVAVLTSRLPSGDPSRGTLNLI